MNLKIIKAGWRLYRGKKRRDSLLKKEKVNLDRDIILVLATDSDEEELYSAFIGAKYLVNLRRKTSMLFEDSGKIVVISDKDKYKKLAEFCFGNRLIYSILSKKERENLLCYYTFRPFGQYFYVASLLVPFGRNCKEIIGKNGITIFELYLNGIFKLNITDLYSFFINTMVKCNDNDNGIDEFYKGEKKVRCSLEKS